MSHLSRRSFVASAAAALPLSKLATAETKPKLPALGVQLYTVRNTIKADPVGVLKFIRHIGYTEVEVVHSDLATIWPALHQTGLKGVSAHVDTGLLVNPANASKVDTVFADLKQKGFSYAVLPYLGNEFRGDADTYKRLADTCNRVGEKAKSADLKFCYHNHAFEFGPAGDSTPLQILMDRTDKKLVSLELDIFWVSVAGHDPVDLLKTYGDRIALVHLKDKAQGLPTQFTESVPKDTFKEVGNGSINIPAVISAANADNVKHFFVEQDQTPGDPLESLRQSYKYLSQFLEQS